MSCKGSKPALISYFGSHFPLTVSIGGHSVYLFGFGLKCLRFASEMQSAKFLGYFRTACDCTTAKYSTSEQWEPLPRILDYYFFPFSIKTTMQLVILTLLDIFLLMGWWEAKGEDKLKLRSFCFKGESLKLDTCWNCWAEAISSNE